MNKLLNVLARMEMQESGHMHSPQEIVEPSWELAKAIIEDELEEAKANDMSNFLQPILNEMLDTAVGVRNKKTKLTDGERLLECLTCAKCDWCDILGTYQDDENGSCKHWEEDEDFKRGE